jgi:hypothetical protein
VLHTSLGRLFDGLGELAREPREQRRRNDQPHRNDGSALPAAITVLVVLRVAKDEMRDRAVPLDPCKMVGEDGRHRAKIEHGHGLIDFPAAPLADSPLAMPHSGYA